MISTKEEVQDAHVGSEPLGVPSQETILGFQTEVFKELINKLAWALGSVYRRPYSNVRSESRQLAILLAKEIIRREGYPEYMRK